MTLEELTIPQLVFVAVALGLLAVAILALVAYGLAHSPFACALAFAVIVASSCLFAD